MRISKEALAINVVVRRVAIGATPFRWEVHRDPGAVIHVSTERYRSMDAAYRAGRARLGEFISSRPMKQQRPGEAGIGQQAASL
jgi:hypothetical protein